MEQNSPQRPNDGLRISPVMNLWQAAKYMRITPQELFNFLRSNPQGLIYQTIGKNIAIHKDVIDKWMQEKHTNQIPIGDEFSEYSNT